MGGKIHRNSLKPGHKILWYEIKEILGQGGFGITYLAYDPNLEKHVAIKEYLPIEIAVREGDFSVHPVTEDRGKQYAWGLERFISEAQTLAKFDQPNVVRVLSVTEENNTAYMVMTYEEGQSLQQKLQGKKTLEEAEILKILIPILGGLETVHKAGFIHRDIKPDNIFIRNDGSPVLLDFGSARQALGEETKTLTSLVSPGYAPFEQYFSKGDKQGAWTDIYGLGATLYRAVAGIAPQDAVDRSNAIINNSKDTNVAAVEVGQGKYSERFLKAIDHAIQFKSEDRPQTVAEWKSEFQLPDDPIKEAEEIERVITQPGTKVIEERKATKTPFVDKVWSILKNATYTVFIMLVVILIFDMYTSSIQHKGAKPTNKEAAQQLAEEEKHLKELEQERQEEKLILVKKEVESIVNFLQKRNGVMYEPNQDKPFTGKYVTYYDNEQKKKEGDFKDGKMVGQWTSWYEDGQKREEEFLKDGEGDGLYISWHDNGQKSSEGNYISGKRDGQWTDWHENGQKFIERHFKEDEVDGLSIAWYDNGQKLSKENFINGERDGLETEWYVDGQKKSEGNYISQQKEGLWTDWYDNGQKKSEGNYVNGKREGDWVGWYENGKKRREGTYKNGVSISQQKYEGDTSEKSKFNKAADEALRKMFGDNHVPY